MGFSDKALSGIVHVVDGFACIDFCQHMFGLLVCLLYKFANLTFCKYGSTWAHQRRINSACGISGQSMGMSMPEN